MARIAGVNLPINKRAEVGLTYVFGIGRSTAIEILKETGVDPNTQVKDLTEDEIIKLRDAVETREVEGDLRRERSQNVKRLQEIGSYRGDPHRRGLPVRGQRTKTNARGRKGPRRMSVAGRKKAAQPKRAGEGRAKCRQHRRRLPPAARSARTSPTARPTSRLRSTTP